MFNYDDDVQVHQSAIVERGAQIGSGTRIWHHAHIRSGAILGRNCSVGKSSYLDSGAVVGDRVRIQNHVSVFTGVTLGDDVMVGPGVCFTNDLYPRARDEWTLSPTTVGAGAGIGANSTIVCGCHIGEWAMVGAGTVVTSEVPPFALVVGNPSRLVGYVNKEGSRVRGAPRA